MIAILCRIAALALIAVHSPLAAQLGEGVTGVAMSVELRMVDSGLGIADMKADATLAERVDPYGLVVRVRTSAGTLDCTNDFALYPRETGELDCLGVYPSPPLSDVTGVTAELDVSLMPGIVEEMGRFVALFARSWGLVCGRVTRAELGWQPSPNLYLCRLREGSP